MPDGEPSRAMSEAAAYAALLDDIQRFVVDHYQLTFESSVPRTRCTALHFHVPLNHFDVDDLKQDIAKVTKGVQVRVAINGNAQKISVLVPVPDAVKWRCCERYSRMQIVTFVVAGFISTVVLLSVPYLMHRLYAH